MKLTPEEYSYRIEKGRQRAMDERRRSKDVAIGIILLAVAFFVWFNFLSPDAQRELRKRQEFKQNIDRLTGH